MTRPGLRALAVAIALCSAACLPARAADAGPGSDAWSYANVGQFQVTNMELSLDVDFDSRQLRGGVALDVRRLDPGATQLVLDTRDLDILGVTELTTDIVGATEKPVPIWISRPYHLGKPDPLLGSPLVIDLPSSGNDTRVIRIDYETSPRARGLRWRVAAGGKERQSPFLYTLSAPINARSWIPLQDTPRVRATYRAHVHAPAELTVLMGAGAVPAAHRRSDRSFVTTRPVAAADIALVVADLRFKPTGPHTGVYADGVAAVAARATADAEALRQAGEELLGPARGDRLDVVVMPAGFPVADLAYPQLVMVSPTLLTGDAGLRDALACGTALGWTAGLAGPEWRDRWLAQALAGYVADRIVAAVHGERTAEPPAAQSLDGVLAADLQGTGYDDIFSRLPRDKGRLMFAWLEARVGRARLDPWLREYVAGHAGQGVTTTQFVADLQRDLLSGDAGPALRDELAAWLFGADAPAGAAADPQVPATDVDLPGAGDARARQQARQWSTAHWVRVLDALPDGVGATRLAALDAEFALSTHPDAAVAAAWYALALRAGYRPALAPMEAFLAATGRLALLEPLYEQLMQSPDGAAVARRVFAIARTHYDPFVVRRLEQVVRP